ncbi:MAG TPA: hypothetical protein VFF30_12125 [Nitrososphaerales archaeon]|nr:hypothetical protein [Nitrososphaerales archaeon]
MPLLLVDTDFLIKIANDPLPKLDFLALASDFTLATTPSVVRELEGLAKSQNRTVMRRATTALDFVKQGTKKANVKVLPGTSKRRVEADLELVEIAKADIRDRVVIATLDHSLLSRLDKLKIPYLTLRRDRPFFSFSSGATYLSAGE